jgi:hypothetical protein
MAHRLTVLFHARILPMMTRYWFGSFTGSGAASGASGSGSVR